MRRSLLALLAVALVALVAGCTTLGTPIDVDPQLDDLPSTPAARGEGPLGRAPDPDANIRAFVQFVVNNVQQSWDRQFTKAGRRYQATELRTFTRAVRSACGVASSESGPFYCPGDRRVYLDLGFFRDLRDRFGAPGDFAQAYVIAHEFGHHVQALLGIDREVLLAQRQDASRANEYSIRLELQADCFAGVWAHSAYEEKLLEEGDLEEGLGAAAAVGDDRIQQRATGRIRRDQWTHGSSEQRVAWFQGGFDAGDPSACDTFSGDV